VLFSLRNPRLNVDTIRTYDWLAVELLLKVLTSMVTQQGDSEVTFSSQAATCYYQSNHSKVEAIPLCTLTKDTTSELAGKRTEKKLEIVQIACDYFITSKNQSIRKVMLSLLAQSIVCSS